MRNKLASAAIVGAIMLASSWAPAQPRPAETKPANARDALRVTLDGDVQLTFAMHEGFLLGLRTARVGGVELSSDRTVVRPLLCQEYGRRGIWPFLRLASVRSIPGGVRIDLELMGNASEALFREEFVFAADRRRALSEGMTPHLAELQKQARTAEKALVQAVADDPEVARAAKQLADRQRRDRQAGRDQPSGRTRRARTRLDRARRTAWTQQANADPTLAELADRVTRFERALEVRALELGRIHRDYYAFAHLRLPSQTCRVDALRRRIDAHRQKLASAGRLSWILRPASRNIAGWPYVGWSSQFVVTLDEPHRVNVLRQVGTWEIGGRADGLTVVNLRYRGLGRISQTLTAAEEGPGVASAWSTTEILPNAAGDAPVVSPAVPPSRSDGLSDRGWALRHRLGAWISKMARGAGTGFVDFQQRGATVLVSFPSRQGSLRALTEVFPGDRELSQTDEQWFANASDLATTPQLYLAMTDPAGPLPPCEMQTRWQEVDQHVRDRVSEELGFVQVEPLPGVGWLKEVQRPQFLRDLADGGVQRWYDQGVRMIVTHTPGWWSDQHRDGPHKPRTPGGNSNRIHDWVPTDDVAEQWRGVQAACARLGVPYFVYLTGSSRVGGPFVEQVGPDPAHWGMNRPGDDFSHGYPPLLKAHNPLLPITRQLLRRRIAAVQRRYGMQGYWADSFQNMWMSQLYWGNGSGASFQRAWWEMAADWSRQGVHLMAESHAFPGLSCSIEVSGWEQSYPFFRYVWKWHRGTSQNRYSQAEHNRMAYRFMANKSWTAPDGRPEVISEFQRLSAEYLAALADMRRSWVLPDDAGMLWLPYGRDDRGVLFSFAKSALPEGVIARPILDSPADPVGQLDVHQTYRVRGDDLPRRFGLRRSPLTDPRRQKDYRPARWVFPAWAETYDRPPSK
jgi:hypothetical protein